MYQVFHHYRWQPSSRCNNWIWHHRLTRWTYSTGCHVQSDGIGEHLFCSLMNLNWKAGYAICKTVQKLMKLICECIWWRHTGYITTQRVSCKANLGKPLCGNLAYACSLCKPILQCPLCKPTHVPIQSAMHMYLTSKAFPICPLCTMQHSCTSAMQSMHAQCLRMHLGLHAG